MEEEDRERGRVGKRQRLSDVAPGEEVSAGAEWRTCDLLWSSTLQHGDCRAQLAQTCRLFAQRMKEMRRSSRPALALDTWLTRNVFYALSPPHMARGLPPGVRAGLAAGTAGGWFCEWLRAQHGSAVVAGSAPAAWLGGAAFRGKPHDVDVFCEWVGYEAAAATVLSLVAAARAPYNYCAASGLELTCCSRLRGFGDAVAAATASDRTRGNLPVAVWADAAADDSLQRYAASSSHTLRHITSLLLGDGFRRVWFWKVQLLFVDLRSTAERAAAPPQDDGAPRPLQTPAAKTPTTAAVVSATTTTEHKSAAVAATTATAHTATDYVRRWCGYVAHYFDLPHCKVVFDGTAVHRFPGDAFHTLERGWGFYIPSIPTLADFTLAAERHAAAVHNPRLKWLIIPARSGSLDGGSASRPLSNHSLYYYEKLRPGEGAAVAAAATPTATSMSSAGPSAAVASVTDARSSVEVASNVANLYRTIVDRALSRLWKYQQRGARIRVAMEAAAQRSVSWRHFVFLAYGTKPPRRWYPLYRRGRSNGDTRSDDVGGGGGGDGHDDGDNSDEDDKGADDGGDEGARRFAAEAECEWKADAVFAAAADGRRSARPLPDVLISPWHALLLLSSASQGVLRHLLPGRWVNSVEYRVMRGLKCADSAAGATRSNGGAASEPGGDGDGAAADRRWRRESPRHTLEPRPPADAPLRRRVELPRKLAECVGRRAPLGDVLPALFAPYVRLPPLAPASPRALRTS